MCAHKNLYFSSSWGTLSVHFLNLFNQPFLINTVTEPQDPGIWRTRICCLRDFKNKLRDSCASPDCCLPNCFPKNQVLGFLVPLQSFQQLWERSESHLCESNPWNAVDFHPPQQKEKSGQSLSENLFLPLKITQFITLTQGQTELSGWWK